MFKKYFPLVFVLLFLFIPKSYSQIDSSEIKSSVPELLKFHDVIYPIWHDAYPNKDIQQLKGFVNDIKMHMENINNAKLPGILRDKENKWKEGLANLNKTAEDYYSAAGGNDDLVMLDAAEKLHMKFEIMVRILRPVLKEVDAYHQTLYIIYHKYFPEKKYTDIATVMEDLIAKADAIVKVPDEKLPKKIADKIPDFREKSKNLYDATVSLSEVLKTDDLAKIDASVESMHSKYQMLESIFD